MAAEGRTAAADCDRVEQVSRTAEAPLSCAEAISNAAKHSGAPLISVYVEIENGVVTAYVRDEGSGFDLAAVPADRRGIAHSISGRIQRHGGTVTIGATDDHLTFSYDARQV